MAKDKGKSEKQVGSAGKRDKSDRLLTAAVPVGLSLLTPALLEIMRQRSQKPDAAGNLDNVVNISDGSYNGDSNPDSIHLIDQNKQIVDLVEYVASRNSGADVSHFANSDIGEQLFLALQTRGLLRQSSEVGHGGDTLPKSAPELWVNREDKSEKPPSFVRRVYGEWLGKGLTRATVRHLDPPLDQAIRNWLRHNEWPADIDLPTLKEQNTRWAERVEREGLAAVIPEGAPADIIRESRRLQVLQSRRRRDTQID